MNAAEVSTTTEHPVSKFVLHNMYGSVFLDKLHGYGKEMRVQLGFLFQERRTYGATARTNIITLAPGEKKTIVVSDLKLWVCNHDETEGNPVSPTEIKPYEVGLYVTWPFIGTNFTNKPIQLFESREQPVYSWRAKPKSKQQLISLDTYQGLTEWLDLRKGTYIKFIRGDVYYDNGIDPCPLFLQSFEEPTE